MKMKSMGWFVVVAGIALAGCGHGGSTYQPKPPAKVDAFVVTEGADQNLVPFQEGNQWTYTAKVTASNGKVQRAAAPIENTYKITKVEKTPEGVRASFEITTAGKVTDTQVWLANDKGLYQISVGVPPKAFTTPQPIIVFPAKSGTTFNWEGSGLLPNGKTGKNVVESKILGPQEVDTAAGRVNAIAIEGKTTYSDAGGVSAKATSTIWLAPGIGIARYSQDSVSGNTVVHLLLELKSHSLKK